MLVKSFLNKDKDIDLIKNKFPSLFQYFGEKALKLLRKGVYPYDYLDEDWENFHSILTNTKYSIDD